MGDMILPPALDLEAMEVASPDLSQQYWTPEKEGERKRMYFVAIQERIVLDQKTGEDILLPCVVFIDSAGSTIVNGSKRLVAVFENGEIDKATPVQVTYKGKKKNRTNGNMSDDWSVVTLAVKPKQ